MRNVVVVVALASAACGGSQSVSESPPASEELAAVWHDARERLLDDFPEWDGPWHVGLRGGRTTLAAPAEPGWCYAYFAVGGEGVRDLDLEVLDSDGRVAGTDTMFDATPYVQHCADRAEVMTVIVTVARGRGDAAIGVLRKPD